MKIKNKLINILGLLFLFNVVGCTSNISVKYDLLNDNTIRIYNNDIADSEYLKVIITDDDNKREELYLTKKIPSTSYVDIDNYNFKDKKIEIVAVEE